MKKQTRSFIWWIALSSMLTGLAAIVVTPNRAAQARFDNASLRGAEAIKHLKQAGTYDSLAAAALTLTQSAKLTASDGASGDNFGGSIAISGNTAVVGALNDDVGGGDRGSAYVFVRNGNTWTQQQQLLSDDGMAFDNFGKAAAISGDIAIVGAFADDIGSNLDQGSAYVFTRSGNIWTQQQKLTASDGMGGDQFGAAIAMTSNTVVIGAPGDDLSSSQNRGSAYVFVLSGNTWTQQQQLLALDGDAGDQFGTSVSISGESVIVGAPFDDVGTMSDQGSAYVFTRSVTIWTQQQQLTAGDGALQDNFGFSVAISGDTAISGAPADDIGAFTNQGSAYIFTRASNFWTQLPKVTVGDGASFDQFGYAVAISGETALIAAPTDDVGAANEKGSVYVLMRTGATWMQSQQLNADDGLSDDQFGASVAIEGGLAVIGALNDDQGLNANQGSAYVFNGAVAAGLQYYPLPRPIRLLDTRPGATGCDTPNAPLQAGTPRTEAARVTCDGVTIPANAAAIVGNATVVNFISSGGFITLYPTGAAQPTVSNLNYLANQIIPNAFTVGLGVNGEFNLFASSTTDIIVDLTGYYAPPGVGGLFYHPLPRPIRLLDTRPGETACAALGAPLVGGTTRTQNARLTCDGMTIPANAQAVVGNGTVVNFLSAGGFITLFPDGAAQPTVSNLNYLSNQVTPNAFTVGLGASGAFKIFASASTHFITDITGYYSSDAGVDANGVAGLLYSPLPRPIRLLDSRPGEPGCETPGAPLTGGQSRTQLARVSCDGVVIPATAQAVVGNGTVVNFLSGPGFVTLHPSGTLRPTVSNLNYLSNQTIPNAFTVGLGANGGFEIFPTTTTHFIVDLTGYFAP